MSGSLTRAGGGRAWNPPPPEREAVNPGRAVREGRLPAPGGPHHGDHPPLSDVEVEAAEPGDGPPAAVVRLHEATCDDDPVLDPSGLGRGRGGRGYGDGFGRHRGRSPGPTVRGTRAT